MTVVADAPDREPDAWAAAHRAMRGDPWLRGLAVGFAVWLAGFAVLVGSTVGSGPAVTLARSVAGLVPLAVAGVLCAHAARQVAGRDRVYWAALAAFCVVRLTGQVVALAAGTGSGRFHGWALAVAGARVLEYVPALVAAVFVCGRPTRMNGLRGLFDLTVVSAAAFYLTWEAGIVPVLSRGGPVSAVLDATTPALDNLILIVAFSAAIGARERLLPARALAVWSFVGLLVVDSLWSGLVEARGVDDTWFAVAHQVPPALLAVGALAARRYPDLPTRGQTLSSRLPMFSITITCCGAALVASSHPGERGRDVAVSAIAVIVVVVRAMLANTELRATAVRLEGARAEQERLAVTDGLTGLYNRRFFEEFLHLEADRSARTGNPVSLIVADLDHFKRVNDVLGHPVGDRVLVEAARRLRATVRGSDVVARYGGEEFAVVLPETDPATALEIAERCRQALHEATVAFTEDPATPAGEVAGPGDGPGVVVSGSFGVATLWAMGDATVDDLVRAADRALYRAKATGRNRVAPAGEWDFLTPAGGTPTADALAGGNGPAAADPVADALFRAAELLEADRSPDGHGAAVGDWAGVLADHLGLDARTRERCVLAGRLRDLGKLAIPLSVLTRPGPLTDAEWVLVRTHPGHGEALVALAPSVADLGPVVRAHHERVDGGGYPDHLTGAAIPVEARIIAVCDAWAAMSTHRAHAAARSVPDRRRELTRGRGTRFDPDIADLFLTLQETGRVGAPDGPATTRSAGRAGTAPGADVAPRAGRGGSAPTPVEGRTPGARAVEPRAVEARTLGTRTVEVRTLDAPTVGAPAGEDADGGLLPVAQVATSAGVADRVVAIATQPHEHAVLQRLVEAAHDLVPARYAVALLVGPDGIPTALAHRGMAAHDVAALPHLPRPVGLVGAVLAGQRLHLARLADHPDSVGFPTGHVPMGPLLGLPITVDGRVQGGLYLTRTPGEPVFTEAADHLATALTAQAGTAVAGLRAAATARIQLDDPARTADRAGDGHPDPTPPSPMIREILAGARTVLGVDLTLLAHVGADRPTVPAADAGPVIGSSLGVPVQLPDGTPYGTLCGPATTAGTPLTSGQRRDMATIAGLIGQRLAVEGGFAETREAGRAAALLLLEGDRSTIVVQPIVDLATGATAGYEALSRFTDLLGAARRPDQVFAEAAHVGLGVRFELAAACAALRLLPDLPAGTYLSVNLSPQAVCDPRTYDLLHDLPLDRIVVELTEHDQVSDYTTIVHALTALRARGLRLAIDDAGSGFAGLHHLAELAPDLIKLDIAFVRHIDTDPARRAVARALIGFAADVGANLIAEGIETAAELDQLRRLGAPLGQGFLLGRPAAPDRLLTARTPERAAVRPAG